MKNLCVCNEKECLMKAAAVAGAILTVAVVTWGIIKHCKNKKEQQEPMVEEKDIIEEQLVD